MNAKYGDRLKALGREGVVRYATPSSVRVQLDEGALDVHYPCDGPYRVLLNLTVDAGDGEPEETEAIRRWAFKTLGIPNEETWEMHVGRPAIRSVQSGPAGVAPLPTPARRVKGLLVGLTWLFCIAGPLSVVLRAPFWVVLLAVFSGTVFVGGLAIWWLTLWALRKDSRRGQFGLGSLLFLTLFVSLYLGSIRGLMMLVPGAPAEGWMILLVALFGLIPVAVSIPFILMMLDALLWAAVWLVKRYRRPPDRE